MASPHAKDITAATFQLDVVEASATAPVLLDFWATWCGPCRTLGPVLEKLATEYGGGFRLGKVDTDKEQDLAYAFGVQGIPFCVLVKDGKPVDGFQGALPASEVVAFLERNGIRPVHDAAVAEESAPPSDPDGPKARFERARTAAAAGDAAGVRDALADFPEEDRLYEVGQRLLAALDWLEVDLSAAEHPAARHLAAARDRFLSGDHAGAMDEILLSATADRDFHEGLARRAMLMCFVVVGETDERLDDYRRRLATLLY